jgi:hypothetical protein
MADTQTLGTVASIITTGGVTMLFFRVQREQEMKRRGEPNWIPVADWLLLGAAVTAIVLVLMPLLLSDSEFFGRRVPTAGCAAALVALVGYVPALLAHYRLAFGTAGRTHARGNPEAPEGEIVVGTTAVAVVLFVVSLILVTA